MENQEERTNRKMLSVMAVAFVLVIAAFAAYYMGLIPGIGQGNKVAEDLKAKVEASKGSNIKNSFIAYAESNPLTTPEQKQMIKNIFDSIDVDFQFTGTKTSAGDGKGTVEIDSPKVVITTKDEGKKSAEIAVPKFFISRDVLDKNHFFYHSDGDVAVSANMSGTMTKIFSISGEQPVNEVKFNADGYTGFFKATTKNIKFIEGRGNTVVATIGESSLEGKSTFENGKMDAYGKLSEKNIMPGDMVKLMLGNIQSISLNADYEYKGDDYRPALNELKAYDKARNLESSKVMADANYKPQIIKLDVKPFDGNLKVNDLSIMMGDSGIVLDANLNFKKSNISAVPFGNVNLKIAQYQKLIDYFSKFFKLPKEQIDKTVQMASEIGKNENGNLTFVISLDGTENIKVNGKNSDEIRAIEMKNYPDPAVSNEVPTALPPAPVASKPLDTPPIKPTTK